MDTRIAQLEHNVAQLRDLSWRVDNVDREIRSLRTSNDELSKRVDRLARQIEDIRTARFNTWWLVAHFAILAVLLGALAHGFKWI